ncbi:MAG: hypothetical protein FWD17_14570, partial [Polyangiaceae bacterium]|nr:hypothetical protein [Polyangiaceae bacterium]
MKARNQKAALPKGWAALPAVVALALSVASPASAQTAAPTAWYVLDDPYNQDQLTELFFGGRSHWLQPWRSALTTQPATVLRDIVGINFNVYADAQMEYAAELLQNSGFKHARVEVGWDSIDYDDPSQIDPSRVDYLTHIFTALRDHGLRPLILLNAN